MMKGCVVCCNIEVCGLPGSVVGIREFFNEALLHLNSFVRSLFILP